MLHNGWEERQAENSRTRISACRILAARHAGLYYRNSIDSVVLQAALENAGRDVLHFAEGEYAEFLQFIQDNKQGYDIVAVLHQPVAKQDRIEPLRPCPMAVVNELGVPFVAYERIRPARPGTGKTKPGGAHGITRRSTPNGSPSLCHSP